MDFVESYIDGKLIGDKSKGILFTNRNFTELVTSENTTQLDGIHGQITSPTIARERIITIEGFIEKLTNPLYDNGYEAIRYFRNLFALQNNLYDVEDKIFQVKDSFGKIWELKVKIKEPLQIEESDDEWKGTYWKYRVVLSSTMSPIYYSKDEKVVEGEEGSETGLSLDTTLEASFDEQANILHCENEGNFPSPAKFVINVVNDVDTITIHNLTEDIYFKLDITAQEGDEIIIDSFEKTATKNGENVLASRVPGSIWQYIKSSTDFIVYDNDDTDSSDFEVKVIWKDALL